MRNYPDFYGVDFKNLDEPLPHERRLTELVEVLNNKYPPETLGNHGINVHALNLTEDDMSIVDDWGEDKEPSLWERRIAHEGDIETVRGVDLGVTVMGVRKKQVTGIMRDIRHGLHRIRGEGVKVTNNSLASWSSENQSKVWIGDLEVKFRYHDKEDKF